MPTSATTKKFGYTRLLAELRCDDEAVDDQLSTIFMRCSVLSELVRGLACTACHGSTLAIRAVDCDLGVVCTLETHCTSCSEVLNKTYASDRLRGVKSSTAPFVVVRSLVSATMDVCWAQWPRQAVPAHGHACHAPLNLQHTHKGSQFCQHAAGDQCVG